MLSLKFLTAKDKWLLALIGSTPHVEGRTRLQKYGILVFKEVFNNEEFFDDWEANDFGGFSPKLANSLRKLEKRDCVQAFEVIKEYGEPVNRYELSEKGRAISDGWIKRHPTKFEEIKKITSYYFQKPLKILLDDVYQKYPEFTIKSKIKAEVNKTQINNQTYLSPQYEIPFGEQVEQPVTPTVSSREHVFNDDEFRKKLAESIGLKEVPSLDPKSFERIKGILDKKIETEDFDSVELVKEVRGC